MKLVFNSDTKSQPQRNLTTDHKEFMQRRDIFMNSQKNPQNGITFSKKLLIIQTSPMHTASTFLVNAIYGIIPELFDKKIIGPWDNNFEKKLENYFKNIIAIKDHNTNIDELINKYARKYKLLFICSERKEKNYTIDVKYKSYNNVVIFDFDELNETTDNTLIKIIDNLYSKLQNVLPNVALDKSKCIERVQLMNRRYEEIKNKPFSYIDDFFEIHGSHRNRK
jgi:hypothetical protein